MEDGSGADGEGDNPTAVLVLDYAINNSNLPVPPIPAEVGYLGHGPGARFATGMLGNAGITVECMDAGIKAGEHVMEFSQIIDVDQLSQALTIVDMSEVHLLPMSRMHGFQVKLSGGNKWKVRVAADRKKHHTPNARLARTSAHDTFYEYNNHELHEIFVPHLDTMRSTIVVSNCIVITVLFEVDDKTGKIRWGDGPHPSPPVYQRRIDMVFHNKYLARLSVRSGFCVLRSAFCVLRSVFRVP